MVAAYEEIKSARMKVQHPAERRTECAGSVVDCGVEPAGRLYIGIETSFGPGLYACYTGREQECSGKLAVKWHLVLGAQPQSGTNGTGKRGVALGAVEVHHVFQVVPHIVNLRAYFVIFIARLTGVYSHVFEAVE